MLLSLLQSRRSVRRFLPRPIEQEKIDQILEAALRAPSSRGRQPWEFIVVSDRERLTALAQAKAHGAEFLAGAALAVVICADPARCDVWIEDCAIAALLLQLEAAALGLGSCWAQLRLRDHADGRSAEAVVRAVLGIPAGYAVPVIIGLGYPESTLPGHPRDALPWDKLHVGSYSAPLDRDGESH
jgi:nitroreductase